MGAKIYERPKTRGELYDNIKNGIECEVAGFAVDTTNQFLQSLAIMRKEELAFEAVLSENEGWAVYRLIEVK